MQWRLFSSNRPVSGQRRKHISPLKSLTAKAYCRSLSSRRHVKAGLPACRASFQPSQDGSLSGIRGKEFFRLTAAGPLQISTGFPIKPVDAFTFLENVTRRSKCQSAVKRALAVSSCLASLSRTYYSCVVPPVPFFLLWLRFLALTVRSFQEQPPVSYRRSRFIEKWQNIRKRSTENNFSRHSARRNFFITNMFTIIKFTIGYSKILVHTTFTKHRQRGRCSTSA